MSSFENVRPGIRPRFCEGLAARQRSGHATTCSVADHGGRRTGAKRLACSDRLGVCTPSAKRAHKRSRRKKCLQRPRRRQAAQQRTPSPQSSATPIVPAQYADVVEPDGVERHGVGRGATQPNMRSKP
eukprot:scaffold261301_cov34-Tisochrysis_lutea.AAC.1